MVAKDYRDSAWSKLTGKWGKYLLISLIAGLIGGACGSAVSFGRSHVVLALICIGISVVIYALVCGPLNLGVSACFLKLVRGENVEIGNMFDGFKNFVKAFVLYLLNFVFIFLWSLLFIIPGIIKAYAYSMDVFILADNPQMEANEARKKSIEMMNGNKWRLFCLDFSFIGWYILCILTLGVLTLWVTPYHSAARAEFYQHLLEEKNGGVGYTQNNSDNVTANGGSVFGSGYEPEKDNKDENDDPYPEFSGDNHDDDTFTKGNDVPPLNADDL